MNKIRRDIVINCTVYAPFLAQYNEQINMQITAHSALNQDNVDSGVNQFYIPIFPLSSKNH